jgi:hypothetical protein
MANPLPNLKKIKTRQFQMHIDDELRTTLNELSIIYSIPMSRIVRHLMMEQLPGWKKIIKAEQAKEAVCEKA